MWCRVASFNVIGLYCNEENGYVGIVNSEPYIAMLYEFLMPDFADVALTPDDIGSNKTDAVTAHK